MRIQKTVSTYLYLLYVTQEDIKPKRSIWMWIWTVFDIGHSLYNIRREVGYFETFNIKYLKFRYCWNKHNLLFALM